MTVATSVFRSSVPSAIIFAAHIAMSTSPSTICPFSSATISRSASPSRAIPRCALCFSTSAETCAGWSAPQRR